jgi:hypothetical protein
VKVQPDCVLGMIPGSLVAAIAKLAVTYVNEQRSAGISL